MLDRQDSGAPLNKAMIPILARLHALQAASTLSPEGGRVIAPAADPAPIAAIMREINETVLGRSLHFSTDAGASMTIEVAGRRLLRVTATEGLEDAEPCVAAPVLEDEHKDGLIKLLQSLAKPGGEIRLRTDTGNQGADGISVGLPAALIADLMLVDLNALGSGIAEKAPEATVEEAPVEKAPAPTLTIPTDGSIVGRFARSNGAVLMAWLIVGGEEDGAVEGPDEMVDHLRAFLDDEIVDLGAQMDRFTAQPGDPVCLALGASLAEGHSILCARADGSILLGLAEGDITQGMLVAWTAVLG